MEIQEILNKYCAKPETPKDDKVSMDHLPPTIENSQVEFSSINPRESQPGSKKRAQESAIEVGVHNVNSQTSNEQPTYDLILFQNQQNGKVTEGHAQSSVDSKRPKSNQPLSEILREIDQFANLHHQNEDINSQFFAHWNEMQNPIYSTIEQKRAPSTGMTNLDEGLSSNQYRVAAPTLQQSQLEVDRMQKEQIAKVIDSIRPETFRAIGRGKQNVFRTNMFGPNPAQTDFRVYFDRKDFKGASVAASAGKSTFHELTETEKAKSRGGLAGMSLEQYLRTEPSAQLNWDAMGPSQAMHSTINSGKPDRGLQELSELQRVTKQIQESQSRHQTLHPQFNENFMAFAHRKMMSQMNQRNREMKQMKLRKIKMMNEILRYQHDSMYPAKKADANKKVEKLKLSQDGGRAQSPEVDQNFEMKPVNIAETPGSPTSDMSRLKSSSRVQENNIAKKKRQFNIRRAQNYRAIEVKEIQIDTSKIDQEIRKTEAQGTARSGDQATNRSQGSVRNSHSQQRDPGFFQQKRYMHRLYNPMQVEGLGAPQIQARELEISVLPHGLRMSHDEPIEHMRHTINADSIAHQRIRLPMMPFVSGNTTTQNKGHRRYIKVQGSQQSSASLTNNSSPVEVRKPKPLSLNTRSPLSKKFIQIIGDQHIYDNSSKVQSRGYEAVKRMENKQTGIMVHSSAVSPLQLDSGKSTVQNEPYEFTIYPNADLIGLSEVSGRQIQATSRNPTELAANYRLKSSEYARHRPSLASGRSPPQEVNNRYKNQFLRSSMGVRRNPKLGGILKSQEKKQNDKELMLISQVDISLVKDIRGHMEGKVPTRNFPIRRGSMRMSNHSSQNTARRGPPTSRRPDIKETDEELPTSSQMMQGKYMRNQEHMAVRRSHNVSTGSHFGGGPYTSAGHFNSSVKTSDTKIANFQTMNSQQQNQYPSKFPDQVGAFIMDTEEKEDPRLCETNERSPNPVEHLQKEESNVEFIIEINSQNQKQLEGIGMRNSQKVVTNNQTGYASKNSERSSKILNHDYQIKVQKTDQSFRRERSQSQGSSPKKSNRGTVVASALTYQMRIGSRKSNPHSKPSSKKSLGGLANLNLDLKDEKKKKSTGEGSNKIFQTQQPVSSSRQVVRFTTKSPASTRFTLSHSQGRMEGKSPDMKPQETKEEEVDSPDVVQHEQGSSSQIKTIPLNQSRPDSQVVSSRPEDSRDPVSRGGRFQQRPIKIQTNEKKAKAAQTVINPKEILPEAPALPLAKAFGHRQSLQLRRKGNATVASGFKAQPKQKQNHFIVQGSEGITGVNLRPEVKRPPFDMTASLNKALSSFAPREEIPSQKTALQQKAANLNFNLRNMNHIHNQLTGQANFLPGLILLGDGSEQLHQPPIVRKENRMVRRQMVTRSLNF